MNDPIILPAAARYLKKIKNKKLKAEFQRAISIIAGNPFAGEAKTGDLSGIFGYDIYYNKTNYEIAYTVVEKNGKTVVVILAGTRENFYNELKQYIKRSANLP